MNAADQTVLGGFMSADPVLPADHGTRLGLSGLWRSWCWALRCRDELVRHNAPGALCEGDYRIAVDRMLEELGA